MARRFYIYAAVFATVAVLVFTPVLLAAGDEPGESHGDAAHGAEKPALLEWDIGAAFWSIVVFVILLVVLRMVAWKPILSGLQHREAFIRDSIADAKRERQEAEKLLADYKTQLEKARDEATALVDEGRRDAVETRKRIHAEAKTEADAIVVRAKKDIGLARDDAIRKLHDQTIMLATTIAGKMIQRELRADDHRSLLDESLAELQQMKG